MIKKLLEFSTGQIIVFILNILSYPIITRIVAPAEMGKYSMNTTMVNLVQILCVMGMDQAFIRYFNNETEENQWRLLQKCLKIPFIFVGVAAIFIFILYKPISFYIINEKSFYYVILFAAQIFLNILFSFFLLYIRMRQQANLYSKANIGLKLSYLIFIAFFFPFLGSNSFTLILANTCSFIAAVFYLVFKSPFSSLKNVLDKGIVQTNYSTILKYSLPFVCSTFILWIFNSIDKLMLRQFSSYHEMGIYSGAMAIVNILNVLQGGFTTFWTPAAFEKYSKTPEDTPFFIRVNDFTSFIMLILTAILLISKDLLILFLGSSYKEASFVFPFLTLMPVMYTISETTVMGINFKEKSIYHVYISIIATGCNVLGNFLLVPYYGAKGAAISTGLAYVIFFIVRTYFSAKCYKVNFYLKRFAVCCIGIYILAIYSSFHRFDLLSFLLCILEIALICVLYQRVVTELFKYINDFIRKKIEKKNNYL